MTQQKSSLIAFTKALLFTTGIVFSVLDPLQVNRGEAAVITTFQDAIQPNSPASGWSYLWNSGGEIGDSANYTPLLPTAHPRYYYNTDGIAGLPSVPPGSYTYFGIENANLTPGGHPGQGPGNNAQGNQGNTIERYAIAAYTLSTSGNIAITNGTLRNTDSSQDGLSLRVYANDSLFFSSNTNPGNSFLNFAPNLGDLNVGDTVYVAIGPRNHDRQDSFALEYSIEVTDEVIPEPTTLVSSIVLGLGWLGFKKRK